MKLQPFGKLKFDGSYASSARAVKADCEESIETFWTSGPMAVVTGGERCISHLSGAFEMEILKFASFRDAMQADLLVILASLFFPGFARGAPICSACHPRETSQFAKSAMGSSLKSPEPLPSGSFTHERSNSTITIEQRRGRMVHRLSERGLTAEYPIAYQIGSGKSGHSYLIQIGDYLLESPASWYNSHGWDVSPGLGPAGLLDVDRLVDEGCLFCHAGAARFSDDDGRRQSSLPLTAITCARCHGDAEDHVRHPSSKNIVNPAKLPRRARDSICEQCHLEGGAKILNPRKSWRDFHPGDNLEHTVAVYLLDQNENLNVASQVEQLSQSKCASETGGKLWCGSCHDPHGQGSDRVREIREVCTLCHPTLSKMAHPAAQSACASCHMPRRPPTDVAHVTITDHRILRRPAEVAEVAKNRYAPAKMLIAWSEPPREFRLRDLGLAELTVGFERGWLPMTETGAKILETLGGSQQTDDPEVLLGLAWAKLQQGLVQPGLALCRRAAERRPASARYAMNFGIALTRSGDFAEAEKQLNRAIDLDPSLEQAYIALAMLYDKQKRMREMIETMDRYLKWNPQSIAIRLQKATISEKPIIP